MVDWLRRPVNQVVFWLQACHEFSGIEVDWRNLDFPPILKPIRTLPVIANLDLKLVSDKVNRIRGSVSEDNVHKDYEAVVSIGKLRPNVPS